MIDEPWLKDADHLRCRLGWVFGPAIRASGGLTRSSQPRAYEGREEKTSTTDETYRVNNRLEDQRIIERGEEIEIEIETVVVGCGGGL